MPPIRDQAIEKMRRDHEHMLQLIQRIQAQCDQRDRLDNCNDCHSNQRTVCHGNIEQQIRAFVEMTLKHNLIESMYMEGIVPSALNRPRGCVFHTRCAQRIKGLCDVVTPESFAVGDGQAARCLIYDAKYAAQFTAKVPVGTA